MCSPPCPRSIYILYIDPWARVFTVGNRRFPYDPSLTVLDLFNSICELIELKFCYKFYSFFCIVSNIDELGSIIIYKNCGKLEREGVYDFLHRVHYFWRGEKCGRMRLTVDRSTNNRKMQPRMKNHHRGCQYHFCFIICKPSEWTKYYVQTRHIPKATISSFLKAMD